MGENKTEAAHRGDIKDSGAPATTEGHSASTLSHEEMSRGGSGAGVAGDVGRVDSAIDAGETGEWDETPEKWRFDVLLGMLSIATMVDADGKANASWAANFSAGFKIEEKEDPGQAISGVRRECHCYCYTAEELTQPSRNNFPARPPYSNNITFVSVRIP